MKKTINKKIVFLTSLVICVAMFCGCNPYFNASEYIKASLDALYRGDFTKYTKVVNLSESDAEKNYQNQYKSQADVFAVTYGIVNKEGKVMLTQQGREKVEEFYKDLHKRVSYTVSEESNKIEDDYNVSVKIKPLTIFKDKSAEVKSYLDNWNAQVMAGQYNSLTDDQYNDVYLDGLLKVLSPALTSPTYGEEQSLTMKVMYNNEKNSYYLNNDSMKKFNEMAIVYPS